MTKKYVLFDLDGTITDSGEGIKNSIKYSLEKFGIEENREDILNSFIGPPLLNSYMDNYSFSVEKAEEVIKVYREYYSVKGLYENFLYNGIEDVIDSLKSQGNKIILATSKPEIFARKVLESHKLTKYFDFIAGATLDHKISKKDDVIKYVLDSYEVNIDKAYMIGDTKFDILGGNKFDLTTVGVTYGYGTLKDLKESKADFIVDTPKEILDII